MYVVTIHQMDKSKHLNEWSHQETDTQRTNNQNSDLQKKKKIHKNAACSQKQQSMSDINGCLNVCV